MRRYKFEQQQKLARSLSSAYSDFAEYGNQAMLNRRLNMLGLIYPSQYKRINFRKTKLKEVRRMAKKKSMLFEKSKYPRLSDAISIRSSRAFRASISKVKRLSGIPAGAKQRALVLAKNRAMVQLRRKNLSMKERREFRTISRMRLK